MMLLTRDTLLESLSKHIQASDRIDVAVAWATDCSALAQLCTFAHPGKKMRAIIGIWGNATHPGALRSLQGSAQSQSQPSREARAGAQAIERQARPSLMRCRIEKHISSTC
jgi:hypothetical protein